MVRQSRRRYSAVTFKRAAKRARSPARPKHHKSKNRKAKKPKKYSRRGRSGSFDYTPGTNGAMQSWW